MKKLTTILLLMLCFCSQAFAIGATYHLPEKANKQAQGILSQIFFEADFNDIYNESAESLKNTISRNDFQFLIEQLAFNYPHKSVSLYGYELYGAAEKISIFARSRAYGRDFYYLMSFAGTGLKGYKLENIRITTQEAPKGSLYQVLPKPIVLRSDEELNRRVGLPDGNGVDIEAVTKTYLEEDDIYAYTLKYRTDIDVENHDEIESLARNVMMAYGEGKANQYGATVAIMTASNDSRLASPDKPIKTYRTIFVLQEGSWVQWQ